MTVFSALPRLEALPRVERIAACALPRLCQGERQYRTYPGPSERPRRNSQCPAAVDEVVYQEDRLVTNACQCLCQLRSDRQTVPYSREPVSAVASTGSCGPAVLWMQLTQVRHPPYARDPLRQRIHKLWFAP